jgi:hypothetical protein
MIKSEKKIKELALHLNGENNIIVSQIIESLRNDEPFEGVVGLLTSLFDRSADRSIKKAIECFMNDLKDQAVRPEIIAEVRKQWKDDTIGMLVSSCWQSGLDFSGYAEDFVEIFIKSDYPTAIECLTVISESEKEISREEKDKLISILEDNPLRKVDEKSVLMLELISILEKE